MTFAEHITTWYYENKRSLPWRHDINAYHVWLSEIIMQQTRIAQGTSYYLKFIDRFVTVKELANAHEDEIMRLWEGLGYYSRARNLHAAAKQIMAEYNGQLPESYDDLIKIKGIGPYTAAAISSICFGEKRAVVDGNVFRVLSRINGIDTPINSTAGKNLFAEIAKNHIAHAKNPGDYNQGIMEFGALHCTPKNPNCEDCIFRNDCVAYSTGNTKNLPKKIKAKPLKNRYLNFLVAMKKNTIAIEKRGKGDIWSGLYQFPLKETLNSDANINSGDLMEPEIIHILSHQRLHIKFWCVNSLQQSNNNISWLPIEDINNLAFPIVLKRFITSKLLPLQQRLP